MPTGDHTETEALDAEREVQEAPVDEDLADQAAAPADEAAIHETGEAQ